MDDQDECIYIKLSDEPGDVVVVRVERGTTFADEEIEAMKEFFIEARAEMQRRRDDERSDA